MRVRVVAPSSPFPVEKLAAGIARLRAAGWTVDDGEARSLLRGRHAYLNGTDEERLRDLEEALQSDADVVWLARGGYGLTRIIQRLDVPARGPILMGFSDATALFAHASGTGARCVHGPLLTSLAAEPEESFQHALAVLERRARGRSFDVVTDGTSPEAEGWVFAGNLCVLAHLAGTSAAPDLEGAILVLEEVGERPYRIDRALTQLKESGLLVGVRALVAGHLTDCEEPANGARSPGAARDLAPRAVEVFRERAASLHLPFAHGLPAGHEPPNFALPLGARAELSGGKLTLLEELP
jgi:muramoyltetrapeptide carboxypeptidase